MCAANSQIHKLPMTNYDYSQAGIQGIGWYLITYYYALLLGNY